MSKLAPAGYVFESAWQRKHWVLPVTSKDDDDAGTSGDDPEAVNEEDTDDEPDAEKLEEDEDEDGCDSRSSSCCLPSLCVEDFGEYFVSTRTT